MQKIKNDDKSKPILVNGIDTEGVKALIVHVAKDPKNANTHWQVTSHWKGGTRSDTKVKGYGFGKENIKKDFTIQIDESNDQYEMYPSFSDSHSLSSRGSPKKLIVEIG